MVKHLYALLGCGKDAETKILQKAYRALCKKHHPDTGGDELSFKRISYAWQILADPMKRRNYDLFGFEGLSDVPDLFSIAESESVLSEEGRSHTQMRTDETEKVQVRDPRTLRRAKDVVANLRVTLKDVILGTMKKIRIRRLEACPECPGPAPDYTTRMPCNVCLGRGVREVDYRDDLDQITKRTVKCQACLGHKKAKSCLCPECRGRGFIPSVKLLKVEIEKGTLHGQNMVILGEGMCEAGAMNGNVNLKLCLKRDSRFRVHGRDIHSAHTISLKRILSLEPIPFFHCDGTVLMIEFETNKILDPNSIYVIRERGIPHFEKPGTRGDLYIKFYVEYPKEHGSKSWDQLSEAFKQNIDNVSKPRVQRLEKYPKKELVYVVAKTTINENDRKKRQRYALFEALPNISHCLKQEREQNQMKCKQQ